MYMLFIVYKHLKALPPSSSQGASYSMCGGRITLIQLENTTMITGNNLDNKQHTNKLNMLLRREAQVLHRLKKKDLNFVKQTKIINTQHWKS